MTATSENDDWLTDELIQRASKLIQDIDGVVLTGTVYVVSRALYKAEKRGREEAAKIAERRVPIQGYTNRDLAALTEPAYRDGPEIAAAIRSGQ